MLRRNLVVSVVVLAVLLLTTLSASASIVNYSDGSIIEYQFYPDKTNPAAQGFGIDSSAGGVETIGTDALNITDSSTTNGGITYTAPDISQQAYAFSMRALVKITDYTDSLERALFHLENVTGRNPEGRIIRSGMAKTFDGKVKVGFVGADGEWIGSTYTTPGVESGFVELYMLKDHYATEGSVSLFLDGVDTGLTVSNTDAAFQYIGSTATQNFRFGTTQGLSGGSPTGAVDIMGATAGVGYDGPDALIAPAIIVPEPITIVLMASGALIALRRRR